MAPECVFGKLPEHFTDHDWIMKSRCLTHLIGFAVVEKNHDGGITHAPVKDEIEKAITSELPVLTVTNLRGFGALAPIPSGIVMITTSVKPADLRNERKQ